MFDWLKRAGKSEHDLGQESLSAFLDGELPAGEHARVERHLQECETCRADLEALRRTVALVRAVPALEPPRSFLLPASETAKQSQVRRVRLSYSYLQAATAVATVLLILVVSGDALLRYAPARLTLPLAPTAVEFTTTTPELLLAEGPTAMASELPSVSTEAGKMAAMPAQSPPADTPVVAPTEGSLGVQDAQAIPSQTFARSAGPPAPAPGATTEALAGQSSALVEPTSQTEPTLLALGAAVLEATEVAEKAIPPLAAAPSAQESPSAQPSAVGEPTSETMALREVEPTATGESEAISAGAVASPVANGTVASEVPTVAPVAAAPAAPPPATAALPAAAPVLPTATPVPVTTAIAFTELPTLQPEVVGPLARGPVAPAGPSGLRAWLEARRTWLPWIELTLGLLAAASLLATLWLRHRARWV